MFDNKKIPYMELTQRQNHIHQTPWPTIPWSRWQNGWRFLSQHWHCFCVVFIARPNTCNKARTIAFPPFTQFQRLTAGALYVTSSTGNGPSIGPSGYFEMYFNVYVRIKRHRHGPPLAKILAALKQCEQVTINTVPVLDWEVIKWAIKASSLSSKPRTTRIGVTKTTMLIQRRNYIRKQCNSSGGFPLLLTADFQFVNVNSSYKHCKTWGKYGQSRP
jgi:hypothetical protein